jgi:hypothetical protein
MAVSGIIPILQRFTQTDHSTRDIPLQIICDLACTSDRARLELKKFAGIEFFLDLLHLPFWGAKVLDAMGAW